MELFIETNGLIYVSFFILHATSNALEHEIPGYSNPLVSTASSRILIILFSSMFSILD